MCFFTEQRHVRSTGWNSTRPWPKHQTESLTRVANAKLSMPSRRQSLDYEPPRCEDSKIQVSNQPFPLTSGQKDLTNTQTSLPGTRKSLDARDSMLAARASDGAQNGPTLVKVEGF